MIRGCWLPVLRLRFLLFLNFKKKICFAMEILNQLYRFIHGSTYEEVFVNSNGRELMVNTTMHEKINIVICDAFPF